MNTVELVVSLSAALPKSGPVIRSAQAFAQRYGHAGIKSVTGVFLDTKKQNEHYHTVYIAAFQADDEKLYLYPAMMRKQTCTVEDVSSEPAFIFDGLKDARAWAEANSVQELLSY